MMKGLWIAQSLRRAMKPGRMAPMRGTILEYGHWNPKGDAMTEHLRDRIAHLRAKAPRLHAVTDDAALIVRTVESFLGDECKFGLTAYVRFDSNFDERDRSEYCRRLEYGRIDGQFRLIVSEIETEESGEEHCLSRTVWANCTREMKLRTIELIPDLFAAIDKRVEAAIRQGESANITVNQLLRDLGIAGKEEK